MAQRAGHVGLGRAFVRRHSSGQQRLDGALSLGLDIQALAGRKSPGAAQRRDGAGAIWSSVRHRVAALAPGHDGRPGQARDGAGGILGDVAGSAGDVVD